jgi:glucan biosynthesis protein C
MKGKIRMDTQSTPSNLRLQRLVFFDNLRVVLTVMVIAHHVAQAYGPTGAWWPVQEAQRTMILDPFLMVNRSFGMSLFFLIAGYFAAQACARTSPRAFIKSRLRRLGIPLIGFSLLMIFLQVFIFGLLSTGKLGAPWPIDVIHMWFVQHLLLYSLGYALWHAFRSRWGQAPVASLNTPGYAKVLLFTIGLALATAIVRIRYDIDEWVFLLGYIRVAIADVPRDLSMFVVGAMAFRNQWVTRFPSKAGHAWLVGGLGLATLGYVFKLWLVDEVVFSDITWGIIYALWESLLCISMCIGLTILFRDKANKQGPILKEMSASSFTVYILHIFVAILFQYMALGLTASPMIKFLLVTMVAVPATFLIANLIRRPGRMLFRRQSLCATAGQAASR